MRPMALQTGQTMEAPRYGAGRRSPLGLGGTVAVHALVIGVFLLIPREVITTVFDPPPLRTKHIPLTPPPPPEPVRQERTDSKIDSKPLPQKPTITDPIVALPKGDPPLTGQPGAGTAIDSGPTIILPPADPPRAPVLTEPAIDPRALAAFQPDYPGAMIRQGMAGVVTVRVNISPEGRVSDIEKISATEESFWLATQRHALRKWRFRPATRDGVAVASTKILTVRFTLTDR